MSSALRQIIVPAPFLCQASVANFSYPSTTIDHKQSTETRNQCRTHLHLDLGSPRQSTCSAISESTAENNHVSYPIKRYKLHMGYGPSAADVNC